jgi:hypothetical protein
LYEELARITRQVIRDTLREQVRVTDHVLRFTQSTTAHERSMELLKAHLTEKQKDDLKTCGWFEVKGSAGGRYHITTGTIMNVWQLGEDGQRTGLKFCFVPGDAAAAIAGDVMLAQKITLENDEPHAMAVANRSDINGYFQYPSDVEPA